MRVRSSASASFPLVFVGLSLLSVACGGQAQDERVSDQFKNNGTGVAPSKGGTGGTGGSVGKGGSGGTGGTGGMGGTVGKGGAGGGGGSVIGKGGGPTAFCGDGFCSTAGGESCANCAIDCGTCSAGAGGGGGSVPSSCSHDVCSTGPALAPICGKCESVVCANDPFCCEREWDGACVQGAQDACGANCGAGGTGGAGGSIGKGGAGGSIGKGGAGGGGGTGTGGKGGNPGTFCGDSICDPNEACNTCPKDCGPCGNNCSHDVCTAGPPLGQNCGKCAAVVCQQDPFCCESFWDATCVSEASQCAPCGGGTAGSGGAPAQDCQSCAIGSCGPQVNACLQDDECQGCLGSADPSCFVNPRVKDLVVCTCNGSCAASCAEECKVFGGGTGGTGGAGGGTGGSAGAGGGPSSICGDGICDGQETCGSCGNDCGSCDCAHGVCFAGGKLEGSCSPCTQTVCSQDPFCCSTEWDDQCVQRAQNNCGPNACVGGQPPKPDPYDACPGLPMTTLQKGAPVLLQGDTCIDRNDYEPSCVEGGVPGNDAVYAVQASAKGTLVVQLSGSSELDPILSIKKACQGPGPLCVNAGVGKGTTEAIKREVEAGETAFIVVDAASGTSGPFKLQLDLF